MLHVFVRTRDVVHAIDLHGPIEFAPMNGRRDVRQNLARQIARAAAVGGEPNTRRDELDRVELLHNPLVREHPGETGGPPWTTRAQGIAQRRRADELQGAIDAIRHYPPNGRGDVPVVDKDMVDSDRSKSVCPVRATSGRKDGGAPALREDRGHHPDGRGPAANEKLGFPPDIRNYGVGCQILRDLGIRKMRLMTNNPSKYVAIGGYGLEIVERVPLEVRPTDGSRRYLEAKKNKMGHLLKMV